MVVHSAEARGVSKYAAAGTDAARPPVLDATPSWMRAQPPAVRPAPTAAPLPSAPRPRGLRKLWRMLTCSSHSATHAAAADTAPAMPASPSTATTLPHALSTNTLRNSLYRPQSAALDTSVTEPDVPHMPTRNSLVGVANTAHDDEDEYGGGIIASVGQTGGAPQAYDIDSASEQEMYAEEQRLISQGGTGLLLDELGRPQPLLPPLKAPRRCLVLDLDETLVHSSFKMVPNADFIVPVEIDGITHSVYVIKRPGVDEFMRRMGELYEVVIFTASLNKYADPVIDILDIHRVVDHRLFRESCFNHHGNYVKDLSQLGRPLHDTIILDNSPASYIFHPANAVPVSSWFNDPHDTELTDLCPFLQDLCDVDDVRIVLDGFLPL